MFPGRVRLARRRIPGAEQALASLSPGRIPALPVPCPLATWPPSGPPRGPFLPVTVAAFASSPMCWLPWRSGPLPGAALACQDCALVDGSAARGLGAPRVSVRRWAAGALRRSGAGCAVAQPYAPAGAHIVQPARRMRFQARRTGDFLLLRRGPLTLPCAPGTARIESNGGCAVGVLTGRPAGCPPGRMLLCPAVGRLL